MRSVRSNPRRDRAAPGFTIVILSEAEVERVMSKIPHRYAGFEMLDLGAELAVAHGYGPGDGRLYWGSDPIDGKWVHFECRTKAEEAPLPTPPPSS